MHAACSVLRTCGRGPSGSLVPGGRCPGLPRDALPLCLMVLPKFSLGPGLGASGPWSGIDEVGILAQFGVVWCGVPCCGVLCCGVLCCAVLWCAVLCCAVLCCAVLKAVLPKSNGRDVLHTGKCKTGGP